MQLKLQFSIALNLLLLFVTVVSLNNGYTRTITRTVYYKYTILNNCSTDVFKCDTLLTDSVVFMTKNF